MNEAYRALKAEHDEIGERILELYAKQEGIREKMKEACTHERLITVQPDPFNEETKLKCKDCYQYFAHGELETP